MDDEGLDRILTAPNVITLVRLLCIPVFVWLLFVGGYAGLTSNRLRQIARQEMRLGHVASQSRIVIFEADLLYVLRAFLNQLGSRLGIAMDDLPAPIWPKK